MLGVDAPFPFAGSRAFLVPAGDPIRILRNNGDGTALVQFLPRSAGDSRARDASGNTTLPLVDLVEHEEELRSTQLERAVRLALAERSEVEIATVARRVGEACDMRGARLVRQIAEILRAQGWRPFKRRVTGGTRTVWTRTAANA